MARAACITLFTFEMNYLFGVNTLKLTYAEPFLFGGGGRGRHHGGHGGGRGRGGFGGGFGGFGGGRGGRWG